MSDIKLLVEVTRDQQIEIEDLCTREGLSISKYFIGLHEGAKRKGAAKKEMEANQSSSPYGGVAPEFLGEEEKKLNYVCDTIEKTVENSGSDDNEGEQQKPKKYKKKKQD